MDNQNCVVRVATPEDAEAIRDIYAPFVADTYVTYEEDVPDAEEIRRRIASGLPDYPWLVAELGGGIAGFVYASQHRARPGYRWSVDVTAYMHSDYRRRGVGRALYTSLLRILTLQDYYNAFAGIALPNAGSVGLHESLGFRQMALYRNVGYKAGGWHDVGWWQLELREPRADEGAPVSPVPFASLRYSAEVLAALAAGTAMLRRGLTSSSDRR